MAADTIPYLLERPDAPPTGEKPAMPTGQPQTFSDFAGRLMQRAEEIAPSREELQKAEDAAHEARSTYQKGLQSYADTAGPRYDAAIAASEASTQRLKDKQADLAMLRRAAEAKVGPPPPRGLQAFLSASPNEQPQQTIGKLMQGIGLFAGMIGGGKTSAKSSLAGLTGALEGWQEGSKVKADRAYAEWKTNFDAMMNAWEIENAEYDREVRAEGLTIEQRMAALKLSALKYGNQKLADEASVNDAEATLAALQKRRDAASKLIDDAVKFQAQYELGSKKIEAQIEMAEQRGDIAITLLKMKTELKQQMEKAQTDQALAGYTPETLTALGQQWALTGKLPSIGQGGKGSAVVVRGKIIEAGIQWAKSQGIDPQSLPSIRAELAAGQQALNVLSRQSAVQEATIRRFDGHVDALIALSKKVPRSEMPAINSAILRGEKDYAGSPEAAAYVAQAFEVSMELARVVLPGSAQGDANTREEARKTISAAYNHEQLVAILGQLRQNAERNIHANQESIKSYMGIYNAVGAGQGGPRQGGEPKPQSGAGKTMKIRRKASTGDYEYAEGPEGPVPSGWEKVGG